MVTNAKLKVVVHSRSRQAMHKPKQELIPKKQKLEGIIARLDVFGYIEMRL